VYFSFVHSLWSNIYGKKTFGICGVINFFVLQASITENIEYTVYGDISTGKIMINHVYLKQSSRLFIKLLIWLKNYWKIICILDSKVAYQE